MCATFLRVRAQVLEPNQRRLLLEALRPPVGYQLDRAIGTTYGLDLRTMSTVRELIRGLASGGGAALVISTDLDELLDLCGRIIVLSGGRLVGEVENGPNAGERVGELMVGAGDVAAA